MMVWSREEEREEKRMENRGIEKRTGEKGEKRGRHVCGFFGEEHTVGGSAGGAFSYVTNAATTVSGAASADSPRNARYDVSTAASDGLETTSQLAIRSDVSRRACFGARGSEGRSARR